MSEVKFYGSAVSKPLWLQISQANSNIYPYIEIR